MQQNYRYYEKTFFNPVKKKIAKNANISCQV